MFSKFFCNLLQNSTRVFSVSEHKILYSNISKSRVINPEKTPRRIPLYKNEEILQEELLSTALESGKVPSIQEWTSLKNAVFTRGKIINEVNFDARAIGYCIASKNYEAAKSLLQFYQSKNENLNIGALGKFMKLCHVCNEENSTISKADEEIILAMYKQIKDQYPILASITAENVIPALSLTKEWKQCLDLIENMKLTVRPSIGTYSVVIKAAFENNDNDLGWKLIHEMSNEDKFPHPSVYVTWLRKIKESKKDLVENVEFLFKYFAEYEILPTKEVLDYVLKIFKPYSGVYTAINKNGICSCCKENLQEIKINQEEFNQLKSVFMDNVIVGKNIFAKTNPEELNRFKTFLASGKYDMVIDGLNVAYSAGNKQRPDVYGRLVSNVVRHFRMKNKKILVLGRVHMNKWPKQYLEFIKSNSKMFLAQNISHDDPFLLYATMSSGLGTSFLSRDFMRGHLYLLMDSYLKKLFRRWQQLHQHSLIYAENNGQVHIKSPFPYLCTAQESKNGWHIPYVQSYFPINPMSFEPPKNWLCLRKK